MPSVSYDFVPGQTVFVIDDGIIKSGTVVKVEVKITDITTTVVYWVSVAGVTTAYSTDIYANCKAVGGYQDVVHSSALSASQVAISTTSPLIGSTLTASVVIDGGLPISLSLVVAGGETFQDILDNINLAINGVAEATIVNNNIRVTSRSTGVTSSVAITDGGTGSPIPTPYFSSLNTHTGFAAAVVGLGDGALEAIGSQVC